MSGGPEAARWRTGAYTLWAAALDHPSMSPNTVAQRLKSGLHHLGWAWTDELTYTYHPQGFSCALSGGCFRVVVHTWPELGLATLDIAMVGGLGALEATRDVLATALHWQVKHAYQVERHAGGGPRAQTT